MNKTLVKCFAPAMLLAMMALPAAAPADPPFYGGQHNSGQPPAPFHGGPDRDRGPGSGDLEWSGDVDDTVIVTIHGDNVDTNTLHGRQVRQVRHDVSGRLPHFPVRVYLQRQDGRGEIKVIQQPRPDNNFTARVRIYDGQHNDSRYHFVLAWNGNEPRRVPGGFRGADRFSNSDRPDRN